MGFNLGLDTTVLRVEVSGDVRLDGPPIIAEE